MHLFYSASQTIKNGYLGRLICHIFGIFIVNFGLEQSKWHGFPNLLGPNLFRDPIGSLLSFLSQTKHPRTIMSTAC